MVTKSEAHAANPSAASTTTTNAQTRTIIGNPSAPRDAADCAPSPRLPLMAPSGLERRHRTVSGRIVRHDRKGAAIVGLDGQRVGFGFVGLRQTGQGGHGVVCLEQDTMMRHA